MANGSQGDLLAEAAKVTVGSRHFERARPDALWYEVGRHGPGDRPHVMLPLYGLMLDALHSSAARVRALEEERGSAIAALRNAVRLVAKPENDDPDDLLDLLTAGVVLLRRERDALRADAARWDDLIAGRFEIECMGTTTRYFNVVTPTGRFFTTADGSDLRPHLDAARQEPQG